MLEDAASKVGCDADIERAIRFAGEDVDCGLEAAAIGMVPDAVDHTPYSAASPAAAAAAAASASRRRRSTNFTEKIDAS